MYSNVSYCTTLYSDPPCRSRAVDRDAQPVSGTQALGPLRCTSQFALHSDHCLGPATASLLASSLSHTWKSSSAVAVLYGAPEGTTLRATGTPDCEARGAPTHPTVMMMVLERGPRATSLPSEALLRCIAPPSEAPPCMLGSATGCNVIAV